MKRKTVKLSAVLSSLFSLLLGWNNVFAHCDGVDGPVVSAAKEALETGTLNPVLIWVQREDESLIEEAFRRTLTVRKLGPEAREMADTYFFETVVRIHRAGEGAPYTGLKPAGRDLGPAIPAADRALATGKAKPLVKLLIHLVETGLRERFEHVMAKKDFDQRDVNAGREYVARYVQFIHYVERIYEAATRAAPGHYPEPAEVARHQE